MQLESSETFSVQLNNPTGGATVGTGTATVTIVDDDSSRQFTISSGVEAEALANAIEQLGWRVYATNQTGDGLSLSQAVEAYRDEYLVERNFGRLKGHPLSLSPMYVERDDHATDLVGNLYPVRLSYPLAARVRRQKVLLSD